MKGIQVKQPFITDNGESSLIFYMPTSGYEDIVFSFAALDEDTGQKLVVDYSVENDHVNWVTYDLPGSYFDLDERI
jgi:hypothetical protein